MMSKRGVLMSSAHWKIHTKMEHVVPVVRLHPSYPKVTDFRSPVFGHSPKSGPLTPGGGGGDEGHPRNRRREYQRFCTRVRNANLPNTRQRSQGWWVEARPGGA